MKRIELLPFPPPYAAALAVSNDPDDLFDPEGWWEFLRFLNTQDRTRLGAGLGLEVGEAFWFWSDSPEEQPFSYFEGTSTIRSRFASRIAALGRSGHMDTLHSYGNFSRHGGFRREHAMVASRVLQEEGFRPRVWVNHGGVHDFQNLWMGCGDLPENPEAEGAPAPEYHLDVTWKLGFRFAWIGELTRVPGQERALRLRDWVDSGSPLRAEAVTHARRSLARRIAYRTVLETYPNPSPFDNRLLRPKEMRDGAVVQTFIRVGDFERASFNHLTWLLREEFLDALETSGGASVLFLHWGRHAGRSFRDLDPGALEGLKRLADRAAERRVWVTTTGRLLSYCEARRAVAAQGPWETEDVVRLVKTKLPDGRMLASDDLAGLSFRTPSGKTPELMLGEETVMLEPVPGASDAVWVPWKPLLFPDSPPEIQ